MILSIRMYTGKYGLYNLEPINHRLFQFKKGQTTSNVVVQH